MTTTAVRSELTIVNVIRAVTPTTGVTRIAHCRERTSVTVIAGNDYVGAAQNKIGLGIVVEQPEIPGDRVVTGTTFILEPAMV